ncbi:hypothetical protein Trydic_g19013 [Trypoxylus dichotomus]
MNYGNFGPRYPNHNLLQNAQAVHFNAVAVQVNIPIPRGKMENAPRAYAYFISGRPALQHRHGIPNRMANTANVWIRNIGMPNNGGQANNGQANNGQNY